jgi:transglutaminase-like putative cysteine protease
MTMATTATTSAAASGAPVALQWIATARRGVERFLHDELLESLPGDYDRDALLGATRAVYVLHQDVSYEYTRPVTDLRQRLVILPRGRHGDQRRLGHRVRVHNDGETLLNVRVDEFGNTVLHAKASSVKRSIEFQTRVVLRREGSSTARAKWHAIGETPTRLTRPDDAIRDAAASLGPVRDVFATADAMSDMIRSEFEYRHDVTGVRTSAADAWQLRAGVCQDMAHVMIAMCSSLGIRARYVSGHLVGDGASHAWVEVLDATTGDTVAIDPTHRRRTDLRYITTATGRDYRDVAPTSGTYQGAGSRGTLRVRKSIRLAEIA